LPFNGSGLFSRVYSWVVDAGNNVEIDAARMDTDTNDIATGLSNCVTKDGQQTITANLPMSGFKLTGLGIGTAAADSAIVSNANSLMCEFRLTLTSGTPVTTSDVTGATTLYCSPYKGNRIALFDGTNWHMRSSAEFSIALGTLTSALPYDVFCYDNSTVPTLEILAWSSATARATALTLQDGVLSKTGALTRRYLGTFYTTATTTTEDSLAKRFVWNYYNRVRRPMRVTEATDTWNYSTATVRQANASTANQLDMVIGVSEDLVSAEINAGVLPGSGSTATIVGVGVDVTNAFTSGGLFGNASGSTVAIWLKASWKGFPGVGRHFLSWNEYAAASGTSTWRGDGGAPTLEQSGIHGEVWS